MTDMKKKKTNVRREVRLGSWALMVASPLIIIGFLLSLSAIIMGVGYMQAGDFRYRHGLEIVAVFGVMITVYLGVGYLYIRRLKELYRLSQQLGVEQSRVTEMMASQLVNHRLADKRLYSTHTITAQEKSPHNQATSTTS